MKRVLGVTIGIALIVELLGMVTVVDAADKSAGITSTDKAGKKHSTKGYVPMKAAPNAKPFKAADKVKNAQLPKKVDLRKMMTKVEDQGDTSSCVANALAGSYEYWIKNTTGQENDVSRLFIYYNARWRAGDQKKDDGSVIQLAMEGLKEFGACPEKAWPFKKPLLLEKPNSDAYKEAGKAKVKEMQLVPTELKAWKEALASGLPIVFGCLLFDSFDQCNQKGGVVPMPNPEDLGRAEHGGHAMCAVGYSDKEKVFIVRNSWGDKWGDKGYCYMPYSYLMNEKFNSGDSWVFIPEVPMDIPVDTWSDDETPVTDGGRGVTFVIDPYPADAYETVELVWWEEVTVAYEESADEDYLVYVEYADDEQWESMEEFEVESVIEEWESANPDEEAELDDYEIDEEDTSDEADVDDAEETDDSEADAAEDEDADAEADESDMSDSSDDEAEDSEAEEDADEKAEEEESDEDVAEEDDAEAEAEEEAEESEEAEEDAEEDASDEGDDSGDEESADEGGGDEGGEEDAGGDEGGYEDAGGDEGGGDDGGGEE